MRAQSPYAARGHTPLWKQRVVHLQFLLVAALLFGGGGVGYGLANACVQILALVLLALNGHVVARFFRHAPWPVLGLLVLTMLWPLLQLVPLPYAMWSRLPGRDIVEQSLSLVTDPQGAWFPVSMDSMRTLTAFVGTIVPATVLVLGWGISGRDRHRLLWTLAILALGSVLLGVFQLSGAVPLIYATNDLGMTKVVHGTFANRNSAGVFLDVALAILCILPLRSVTLANLALRVGLFALLGLGVIGTMSRSGTALLLLPVLFCLVRLWATRKEWIGKDRQGVRQGISRGWLLVFAVGGLLVIGAVAGAGGGRLASTFERYQNLKDQRPEIWADAIDSAKRYWPVGAGTGTFDEVFQADESLEYVTERRAGRAHNDYIEMAVESGPFAELIALAWVLAVLASAWCVRKREDRWTLWASAVGLGCFILQSGIDYPLRNQANLCVAGLLFALCATAFRPRNMESAA